MGARETWTRAESAAGSTETTISRGKFVTRFANVSAASSAFPIVSCSNDQSTTRVPSRPYVETKRIERKRDLGRGGVRGRTVGASCGSSGTHARRPGSFPRTVVPPMPDRHQAAGVRVSPRSSRVSTVPRPFRRFGRAASRRDAASSRASRCRDHARQPDRQSRGARPPRRHPGARARISA